MKEFFEWIPVLVSLLFCVNFIFLKLKTDFKDAGFFATYFWSALILIPEIVFIAACTLPLLPVIERLEKLL